MGIPARYRSSLVAHKSADGCLAVPEIRGKAYEAMPQDVRRYITRKAGEARNPRQELLEMQQRIRAEARGREHFVALGLMQGTQHVAGRVRQRANAAAGLAV